MDVSSQDDPIGVNSEKVQSILDNHVIRKLFYNWVNLQRKLASRTATARFLEECANSKLVPDTFRVKIYWRGPATFELKHLEILPQQVSKHAGLDILCF